MRTLDSYSEALNRFTACALAVIRIIAALLFMQHGLQKLFSFPSPSEIGLPAAWTLGWFAGWIEAAGGALLVAGLLTRAVAFFAAGEMAIAYCMVHAPKSFYSVVNGGDLAVLFALYFCCLCSLALAPGASMAC
jgi:putative oxidoreductase